MSDSRWVRDGVDRSVISIKSADDRGAMYATLTAVLEAVVSPVPGVLRFEVPVPSSIGV